jgi:hypothetical protein
MLGFAGVARPSAGPSLTGRSAPLGLRARADESLSTLGHAPRVGTTTAGRNDAAATPSRRPDMTATIIRFGIAALTALAIVAAWR